LRYGDKVVNSFGSELVSISAPDKYIELLSRNKESETISYPSIEFPVLNYKDILDSPEQFIDDIQDKVILMGDLNDGSDYHVTPVNVGTPGVLIHAYIIDTILNSKYITSTPVWLSWAIAFLVCLIFVAINFFIGEVSSNLGNLVMRILQVVCIYLFFALGCKVFVTRLHYIDFAPTLLMIGLGLFAYDLWMGMIALFEMLFKRKK
jgi:CHASE2 domain-containing sensor protein